MGFAGFLRVDFETVHSRFRFSLSPVENDFAVSASGSARGFRSTDVRTVWWRRGGSYYNAARQELPYSEVLDETESYWAFRWMVEALSPDKFPLSHPLDMSEASNKILQLQLASQLGLKVPASLFTNDKMVLADFASNYRELVIKPLKIPLVKASNETGDITLIARPVSSDRIRNLVKTKDSIAIFCQEKVSKVADIRLNVLPMQSFACRINAPGLGADEVDWRPTTMEHKHEIIPVPTDIEAASRELLRRLNLRWGAFDFGLTGDDEWIFFECNPNGQWLWIELKTGLPLSKFFAEELLNHHNAGDVAKSAKSESFVKIKN